MNSINIYNLTRVSDNEDFAEYEYILSGRKDFQRTRIREKESLIILVRELIKAGAGLEDLDNYFYSYTIAHISKEFDLLRISSNRKSILNIELKSEDVGEDRIKQPYLVSYIRMAVNGSSMRSAADIRVVWQHYVQALVWM